MSDADSNRLGQVYWDSRVSGVSLAFFHSLIIMVSYDNKIHVVGAFGAHALKKTLLERGTTDRGALLCNTS